MVYNFVEVTKASKRMCDECSCDICPVGSVNNGVGVNCPNLRFDMPEKFAELVTKWAKDHPEKVYPTWGEWFLTTCQVPLTSDLRHNDWETLLGSHIPSDIAQKLGIEPKENV